jgi:hypothetical protein
VLPSPPRRRSSPTWRPELGARKGWRIERGLVLLVEEVGAKAMAVWDLCFGHLILALVLMDILAEDAERHSP